MISTVQFNAPQDGLRACGAQALVINKSLRGDIRAMNAVKVYELQSARADGQFYRIELCAKCRRWPGYTRSWSQQCLV